MKKIIIQNIRSFAIVAAASSSLLVGCQKTDYPDPQPSTAGLMMTAKVLFVNASNAAGLTALIENMTAATALTPRQSTSYVAAPVSSNQIRIKGAGGTFGTNDLASKTTLLANTSYSVFVTDSITRPSVKNALTGATTDAGGIRLLTVTDNLTAPTAGNANVRFLNLAADVASVSLRLQPTAPASVTVSPAFAGRAYRGTTITVGTGTTAVTTNYANFTSLPAGTYVAQLYAQATVPTAATAVPAASTTLAVADGKIYTVYSRGLRRTSTLSVGTVLHN